MYESLGILCTVSDRLDEGLLHLRRGLALSAERGKRTLIASALGRIGAIRHRQGAHAHARRLLVASVSLYGRVGVGWGAHEMLIELGTVELALGRPDLAETRYRAAIAALQHAGNPAFESVAYSGLGDVSSHAGDQRAALQHYERAATLAEKVDHRHYQAKAMSGIGRCLLPTEPQHARAVWARALQLVADLEVPERDELRQLLAGVS
jgi:tetratricopeptide (TPR) repeat protein